MMIVDDEEIIRYGISTIIDWEKYSIQVISTCRNGLEAYDNLIDEYPNIIITDIKMPGMDGLSFISHALDINKSLEFIILSGYAEFELAQEAMRYGVKHYLLKPCNENQLIQAVQQASQDYFRKAEQVPELPVSAARNGYGNLVNDLMRYTEENLSNPRLTLKWLAENFVYMNVDYLSRLFYKKTGEKYSAYLNRLRMDKAKILILSAEEDCIYRVAEQVGCGNNPQYFSQLFRKWTGCTPSQYRAEYLKNRRI